MTLRLELIEYWDHWSDDNGWVSIDEESSTDFVALRAQSCGWIIAENEQFLKIAANLDGLPGEAENCFGVFTLSKADIIKRVVLRD